MMCGLDSSSNSIFLFICSPECEAEIFGLWYHLVRDVNDHIVSEDSGLPIIQRTLNFINHIINMVDEVISAGLLSSFMKFGMKPISMRASFMSLAIAAVLALKIRVTIDSYHPFHNELNNINKNLLGRLSSMRKNKSFLDVHDHVDKALEFMDLENKNPETSMKLLHSWVLAHCSGSAMFKFMISEK